MHPLKHPVPVALRQLHELDVADPVALMDATAARLANGADVAMTLELLSDGLWWLKSAQPRARWRETVAQVRAHRAMALLHENPFTARAFRRPRGHSGDAALIDMLLYGRQAPAAAGATARGLAMLDRDAGASLAVAMQERRDFMAALIDHVAEEAPMPRVLVASCGHFREGLLSRAVQEGRLGRLVAQDQDEEALEVVGRDFASKGVELVGRGVKALADDSYAPGSFDLVYAAGLFESLMERFAKALVRSIFSLLRPGGRLVVGNVAPNTYDAGYLEAVADWFLVQRDASEMLALANLIPDSEASLKRVYTRQSPDIFYLEVRKRGAR